MDPTDLRREWEERSGEFSPRYYAYRGENEASAAVRRSLDRHLDRTADVLEVGCSAGRHLAHLHDQGFEDLTGIDLNEDAAEVMAETYPDLAADGEFYWDAVEAVVGEFEDDRFDAVYAVETLQHLHPDSEWVLEELVRVTGDLLLTVEIEEPVAEDRPDDADVNYVDDGVPLYYRDWGSVFTDLGLVEVDAERRGRDTVRTFRTT